MGWVCQIWWKTGLVASPSAGIDEKCLTFIPCIALERCSERAQPLAEDAIPLDMLVVGLKGRPVLLQPCRLPLRRQFALRKRPAGFSVSEMFGWHLLNEWRVKEVTLV